ncbi:hypothetical protein TNCV_96161 [Trichonephila clavipes]|nr:hypothetical protein TNCV_96161 [Trichonephila clavipes]
MIVDAQEVDEKALSPEKPRVSMRQIAPDMTISDISEKLQSNLLIKTLGAYQEIHKRTRSIRATQQGYDNRALAQVWLSKWGYPYNPSTTFSEAYFRLNEPF